MPVSLKTLEDYKNQTRSQIVQQFKDSTNLLKLIDSYSDQISSLENMLFDLLEDRLNIDNASGLQLDNLGKILDVAREGDTDTNYRILLKAIIGIYSSNGTVESILSFIKSVDGSDSKLSENSYPAYFLVELQSAYSFNPLRMFNLISLAKPAGVGLQLYAFPTNPFTYSDALLPGGGPNGEVVDALLGFGDATDGGTTGGEFATIIGDAI